MSTREDSIVCAPACQGFLKKRKDKIKLKWVTYWFELYNSTLFFYNKEHGSSSDLRGKYYLIEVQSVREMMWTKKQNYSFELTMKNGKRKVLAAETADLRQLWMCQLLQAMNHRVCNTTKPNSNSGTTSNSKCRTTSSPCSVFSNAQPESSHTLVMRHHFAEPVSYLWSPSVHSAAVIPTACSQNYIDVDLSYADSSQCTEHEVMQKAELENDYDVLPPCKPLHTEEPIYDTPRSNRRVSEAEYETIENIYDVPKYAFRKMSANEASCAKELPEISGLLHEMMTCLGGNSADLFRVTAPGTICHP
ncbi:uncharacterized protein LOC113643999 isoform X2 [Tachysurus fulvidraco]|uniref:uncharacterized protein LOC113643999 isoform X2 n=1 Tax=Tachysurus fulvidraco TaxID=1234273 RepID=UPI001FEDE69B|nr:uncharacterized protein LOC113643999 isoform X2 [Tachysurus fulvidraco]